MSKCLLPLLLAVLAAAPEPGDGTPAFGDPTVLTNAFVPFQPGSVNIFRGHDSGSKTAALVLHLQETRVFAYGGGEVECRILEEQEFEDGVLVEISTNYLAQDDDGNVRFFGEISWEYEAGVLTGAEPDSWLVGGPTLPGDPPGALAVDEPAMYMPAELHEGDSFVMQDLPGAVETITVLADDLKLKVPAGKFSQVVKLQELDDGEDGAEPPSYRWVVPGLGIVREKTKGQRSDLIATSLPAEDSGD